MRRAFLVALAVLTLASCGGQDGSSTPPPVSSDAVSASPGEPVSAEQAAFRRAVNDACREYAERDEEIEFPEELDDYVPFMRDFIENAADLDEKLAKVRPPDDVDGFDDYVADNLRQTAILRAALPKVEAAVEDDDQAEADDVIDDAIEDFNAISDELDPYARRHGLTDCASDPEE